MRKLFALLALFISTNALAVDLDTGIGICHYRPREEGLFYQAQYGFNGDLNGHCFEIGVSDKWSRGSNYGWRVAYVDLGDFTGNNLVTALDGDAYQNGVPCNTTTLRNCLYYDVGHGNAHGFSFGLTAEKSWGKFSVGVEGGLYIYRSYWDMNFVPFPGSPAMPPHFEEKTAGIHQTLYEGITLKYSVVYVSVKVFDRVLENGPSHNGSAGLTGGIVPMYSIGLKIPF